MASAISCPSRRSTWSAPSRKRSRKRRPSNDGPRGLLREPMANTIHVDVVSAEEQIFSGEAEFVVLPGIMGELGIYPRHTPLLTQIRPGALRVKLPDREEEELVFVQGGFLEVQRHRVTVLADTA